MGPKRLFLHLLVLSLLIAGITPSPIDPLESDTSSVESTSDYGISGYSDYWFTETEVFHYVPYTTYTVVHTITSVDVASSEATMTTTYSEVEFKISESLVGTPTVDLAAAEAITTTTVDVVVSGPITPAPITPGYTIASIASPTKCPFFPGTHEKSCRMAQCMYSYTMPYNTTSAGSVSVVTTPHWGYPGTPPPLGVSTTCKMVYPTFVGYPPSSTCFPPPMTCTNLPSCVEDCREEYRRHKLDFIGGAIMLGFMVVWAAMVAYFKWVHPHLTRQGTNWNWRIYHEMDRDQQAPDWLLERERRRREQDEREAREQHERETREQHKRKTRKQRKREARERRATHATGSEVNQNRDDNTATSRH
ncbi:hypothetical protein LTR50_000094 [Elasticomyces elasticus]|nr:hypothetical protein LTR50_000094 [Elasticomyces elasticus]